MFKIGDVTIDNPIVIAPLAGISNIAFRVIAKEFGAGLVCNEATKHYTMIQKRHFQCVMLIPMNIL